MRIDRLELEGFRNYIQETAVFDPRCNVVCGENAQGKTNLLESLVYLSRGKSPRARTDREMIGFEREFARVTAAVESREREFRVQADLFRGRRRKITVNQVPIKTNAALGDVYHTVLFQPEDLYIIREGAAVRRRFMDTALCQLRPRYGAALAGYERARDHKTRILREFDHRPDPPSRSTARSPEKPFRWGMRMKSGSISSAGKSDKGCQRRIPRCLSNF